MSVDTLTLARELREATLPPEHAEAIAAAIGKSISDGAATKADIELVLAKMDGLEQRLTVKIETMRSTLLIWLIGVVIAASGLFITIGKIVF